MTAEFASAMQAASAEHNAQLRALRQERREADEDAARHHAAAMQSAQQAHELEQVPMTPLSTPSTLSLCCKGDEAACVLLLRMRFAT